MATSAPRAAAETAAAAARTARVGAPTSLTGLAATVFRSARDVIGHTVEIAALESRLAGMALAAMAAIAVAVMVLVLSAWGLLLAAAAGGLMAADWSAGAALSLIAALNLVVAGVLALIFLRLTSHLKFSATRRVLEKMRASREADATNQA